MKSMLVRFKNKDYYVKYDDLLNKAAKNLFAYEDPELTKIAKYRGGTLIFKKEDLEDKLRTGKNDFSDIKMDSPMPGAAKTENINNTNISDQSIKTAGADMGKLVKEIPTEVIERALNYFKSKADIGVMQFANNMKIKKLEKALEHKKKYNKSLENKMTNEQKLRKYIREMIIETLKEDAPYGQPDEDKYLFKTDQDYLQGIQGESLNEDKKTSIVGTAKLLDVNEGNVSLQYDKNIVKWFKQFSEDSGDEIIYMNYESLAKQISKLVGVEFDDYIDYPYWDEHYTHCMDFHTDEDITDEEIKNSLKGKIFTIKLKVELGIEENFVNEEGEEGAPSAEELEAKKKAAEANAKKVAYQRFFSQALAKFGYSSSASIPDEKKKAFYDYIDANWTSKQEAPKTEGYADWPNYRDNNNEYYEIDLTKCTHNEAINIIDKLKYKPGIVDVSYSDSIFHTEPAVDLTKYLTPKELECVKKRNINETSATGGVAGYETPRAFTGKKGISKKQKSIANQLGYELVDKSYAVKDQGDVQDLKEGLLKEQGAYYDRIIKILYSYAEIPVPELKEKVITENYFGDVAEDIVKSDMIKEGKLNKLKEISETSIRDTIMSILDNYNVQGTNSMPIESGIPTDDFTGVVNQIMAVLRKVKPFGESINEGLDSYYFKDENLTAEQKLGLAMRQVRNNLYEVEKVVQRTIKMKNEENVDSSKVGKRTYSALRRINEKVVRLMVALQELK